MRIQLKAYAIGAQEVPFNYTPLLFSKTKPGSTKISNQG